jgi:hypothetical protein
MVDTHFDKVGRPSSNKMGISNKITSEKMGDLSYQGIKSSKRCLYRSSKYNNIANR